MPNALPPIRICSRVERHGKAVAEIHLTKEQDKWTELRQQIASFQQSSYRTCGIICQTEAAMTAIKQQLVEVPLTCLTKETKQWQKE